MNPSHILIIDDEPEILTSLAEILEDEGYEVQTAPSAQKGRELMSSDITLCILDVRLKADDGLLLLADFKRDFPSIPVIMISGHGTVSLTAEAFRLGAHDFMEKPLRLIPVKVSVRNALESVSLKNRVVAQTKSSNPVPIYQSASMKKLYTQVHRLAPLKDPVVILGPSGSGKELVARALHIESARCSGPFITTNAASMPISLAEDELFGHEKGAFTGATGRRIGCIESADGGTLFFDEIGDLDPQIQAKLLRVLENGILTRVGGTTPIRVATRIIAATHKNLEDLAQKGIFRHDLWFRLSAFVIRVPALSEHAEDIPHLASAFCAACCADMHITRTLSDDAIEALCSLTWPGNIRELKHTITRAVVYSDETIISAKTIAETLHKGSTIPPREPSEHTNLFALDFRSARDTFERDYLQNSLAKHNNNITAAAAAIGMAQSNLSRKLKELGLRDTPE